MEAEPVEPVDYYRLTLNDQEPLKETILDWATGEGIEFAWLHCVGQLRFADVAAGQRTNDVQSKKLMQEMTSNRHAQAQGTLVNRDGTAEVHIHGSLGRGRRTVTGCWSGDPHVFYGMEVLVTVLETAEDGSHD